MRAETEGTFPKRVGVRHSEEMNKMRQRPSSSLPFPPSSATSRRRNQEHGR